MGKATGNNFSKPFQRSLNSRSDAEQWNEQKPLQQINEALRRLRALSRQVELPILLQ